jgi:hypothetical protein
MVPYIEFIPGFGSHGHEASNILKSTCNQEIFDIISKQLQIHKYNA